MKIGKKGIVKKIRKMVKDEEVEEVMKGVVGLKVVVQVRKRVKLKVIQMRLVVVAKVGVVMK
ncbi:hypothetical protein, partial [Staphylococcus epidermidis]|uniref:hypothetical protein n=1 Tax=Staphylococcus epidermidis TaxID=1282 RepID=UPI0011A63239